MGISAIPSPKTAPSLIAFEQTLLVAGITCLATALSVAELGSASRVAYVGSGLMCGGYYIRRSPTQFLTITLWFWTTAAFVRRLIDFNAGFDQNNIVLITPNLMTLFMLHKLLSSPGWLRRSEVGRGNLLIGPIAYGLAISLIKGDIFPGLVAAADWTCPLLYYFYIILAVGQLKEDLGLLMWFLVINSSCIEAYAILQYLISRTGRILDGSEQYVTEPGQRHT